VTTPQTTAQAGLAARLLAALEAATVDESVLADDGTAWHNFDEIDMPIRDVFGSVTTIRTKVPDFRFDGPRYHDAGDTTIIQYTLRGTLPDGSEAAAPACLVVHTSGDRVTRIEEYLDTAQLTPILALLG
jgi:ketosteroid isomerase-like protein